MRTSEQTDKLFAAIAAAQAEMPAVPKGAVNGHFKNKYATLDAVHAVAQPILAKHGIALLALTSADVGTASAETLVRVQVGDQWLEDYVCMQPRSLTPQDIGSVSTYCRRYLYGMLFGLCCCEPDDDGNSTSKQPAKPRELPWKDALNDALIAEMKKQGLTYQQVADIWQRNPNVEAFQAAIIMGATDELPM
jgi:hypothetical protein